MALIFFTSSCPVSQNQHIICKLEMTNNRVGVVGLKPLIVLAEIAAMISQLKASPTSQIILEREDCIASNLLILKVGLWRTINQHVISKNEERGLHCLTSLSAERRSVENLNQQGEHSKRNGFLNPTSSSNSKAWSSLHRCPNLTLL